jgi:hypothetical protein
MKIKITKKEFESYLWLSFAIGTPGSDSIDLIVDVSRKLKKESESTDQFIQIQSERIPERILKKEVVTFDFEKEEVRYIKKRMEDIKPLVRNAFIEEYTALQKKFEAEKDD